MAGQQQGLQLLQQQQQQQQPNQRQGPIITVFGDVKNHVIPWSLDLTLAKALVAAEYIGPTDPTEIVIVRAGQGTAYDPTKLLEGEDVMLEPNDVVTIRR